MVVLEQLGSLVAYISLECFPRKMLHEPKAELLLVQHFLLLPFQPAQPQRSVDSPYLSHQKAVVALMHVSVCEVQDEVSSQQG